VWLDGWRSVWCWRVANGVAIPVLRPAVNATLHGIAHHRRGRFHAEFFSEGDIYFQWGRRVALWTEMTFENEPLSASTRRFSVYRGGRLVQQFSYRRARIVPAHYGGFPPEEADRDWYVGAATRPSHSYDEALSGFARGWRPHG